MMGAVSSTAAMWTAFAAIIVATIGGVFGWRNSGRVNMSADQRAWLTTALAEARQAKTEATEAEEHARRATTAANSASDRADVAERRLTAVAAQAEDLADWIGRVVRAASDVNSQQVDDPRVTRLLGIINGGPPSMSSSQIHRQHDV